MSVDRRAFLRTSLAAVVGQTFLSGKTAGQAGMPGPHMLQMNGYPVDAETPLELLTDYITPIELFFVRSHWQPHMPNVKTWRLKIDGEVDHPLELSIADLKKMPRAERTCVVLFA